MVPPTSSLGAGAHILSKSKRNVETTQKQRLKLQKMIVLCKLVGDCIILPE